MLNWFWICGVPLGIQSLLSFMFWLLIAGGGDGDGDMVNDGYGDDVVVGVADDVDVAGVAVVGDADAFGICY